MGARWPGRNARPLVAPSFFSPLVFRAPLVFQAPCQLTSNLVQLISRQSHHDQHWMALFVGLWLFAIDLDWSYCRETDLSTEQARPQAPARFPRPHEHGRRRQSHRAPPFEGPQAPLGLASLRATRLPAPCEFRPWFAPGIDRVRRDDGLEREASSWRSQRSRKERNS